MKATRSSVKSAYFHSNTNFMTCDVDFFVLSFVEGVEWERGELLSWGVSVLGFLRLFVLFFCFLFCSVCQSYNTNERREGRERERMVFVLFCGMCVCGCTNKQTSKQITKWLTTTKIDKVIFSKGIMY
eukprot:c10928_g1_i3.p2 GENE.c10928_g1_i3~~c10928_g1_i3.p2  ORF type:complete len:128 (+),score=8.85 c10928_g1_i3:340-723(+)